MNVFYGLLHTIHLKVFLHRVFIHFGLYALEYEINKIIVLWINTVYEEYKDSILHHLKENHFMEKKIKVNEGILFNKTHHLYKYYYCVLRFQATVTSPLSVNQLLHC